MGKKEVKLGVSSNLKDFSNSIFSKCLEARSGKFCSPHQETDTKCFQTGDRIEMKKAVGCFKQEILKLFLKEGNQSKHNNNKVFL